MTRFAPLIALTAMLVACGDDKEAKPKKRNLSFATPTATYNEADGTIEIEVVLDKPAKEDITIDFSIAGGTARDSETAEEQELPTDYEILNDDFEIEIEEGELTGIIEIELRSDILLEEDETIEIQLDQVSSENVILSTTDNEVEITLTQEQGMFVALAWDDDLHGDVDLDMFLWLQDENGDLAALNFSGREEVIFEGELLLVPTSLIGSFASPEYFFLPTALIDDGDMGLGCTYYAGPAATEVEFEVAFIEVLEGGVEGDNTVLEGVLTEANINKWDDETLGTELQVAVTFTKSGDTFSDFAIDVPAIGSRAISSKVPEGLKRTIRK